MAVLLMIIFEVENRDLKYLVVNTKRQPPVGRNVERPSAVAKLMRLPEGQRAKLLAGIKRLEKGKLQLELLNQPGIKLVLSPRS